jgi:KTSC domain
MRRGRVDSTSVASIGYQPVRRELDIEFRESGDVYRYFDVPLVKGGVNVGHCGGAKVGQLMGEGIQGRRASGA